MFDPNCPKCGAHDYGLFRASMVGCPHCLRADNERLRADAERYQWLMRFYGDEIREMLGAVRTGDVVQITTPQPSRPLGQGDQHESVARAEAVATPGTPGGGATVQPQPITENPPASS